jgi:hypothetical protein
MYMLAALMRKLDAWIAQENMEAWAEGMRRHRPCTIRVLGQTALFEAAVPLTLAATRDVDVYADYDHAVQKQFEALLAAEGKLLDPVGAEVWMPAETRYSELYRGQFVTALVAEPDFVLISKAKTAPDKNRALVVELLAKGASDEFFALAKCYGIDLERFV